MSLNELLEKVAGFYGLTTDDLKSPCRKRELCVAREAFANIAVNKFDYKRYDDNIDYLML